MSRQISHSSQWPVVAGGGQLAVLRFHLDVDHGVVHPRRVMDRVW
jgi:hypothetical protein